MTSISFWQEQAGFSAHAWSQEPALSLETDLCVIGAGIIGGGAAYLAAERGLDVVVLEARESALGASGRNAGMLLSGIAANYSQAVTMYGREQARSLWALSVENREMMLALAQAFNVPTHRCGSWLLADDAEEATALQASAQLLRADGFEAEYFPSDPLGRGFLAGLYRPSDAVTQPALLTRGLLAASHARVIDYSPVTRIELISPRHRAAGLRVVSQRAEVRCRYVFLATNAYAPQLHPFFADKILPCRGQIQVSEPAPMVFTQAGYSHFGYFYFRQIPEADDPRRGRWLMGGARHRHFTAENGHVDEHPTAAVQSDLSAYTARYFPELADVPISHRWAGTMGFTPDGLPLVGMLPDLPGAVYCVGFNGHGMGLGIKVVERALALLLEGRGAGMFAGERTLPGWA